MSDTGVGTVREIERKYELPAEAIGVPDLTGVEGVSAVRAEGVVELDAVYYDTAGLRLAADALTLRRRTGGADEGWHLKFPVATGIRDEIRAPLADTLPPELAGLLRSRTRDAGLFPVVRLRSSRDLSVLLGAGGEPLAEVSVDAVRARRLPDGPDASWTEVEVEQVTGEDTGLLDAVETVLYAAGLRPAAAASKLGRALAETGRVPPPKPKPKPKPGQASAGDRVLAYLRTQTAAIVDQDPAVRRDLPDSVHQLRVATRRLRSAFRTYGKVLDRTVTDPVGEELKWLAAELGVDRDHEVLAERIGARIDALPEALVLGPVRRRAGKWAAQGRTGGRSRSVAVLDSARYLALLDRLDALLAAPPLRPAAASDPRKVFERAVLKDYRRLADRVGYALALSPGERRDEAFHNARKSAKRARYAAEAARPVLGAPAKRFAERMKDIQTVLGDHQDSVVAREALKALGGQAQGAGESAFTWGLLYGQEAARAERRERELPEVWARASEPGLRAALKG
ncbi:MULTISPECIES: CHAD domain-containing protein [unclassified Streptomyces]|uniref:CYTH and CHAD domain-containing protein n=1 Tax=unclassified Streptomyces TaxID=2593676 RepID=UPI00381BD70B